MTEGTSLTPELLAYGQITFNQLEKTDKNRYFKIAPGDLIGENTNFGSFECVLMFRVEGMDLFPCHQQIENHTTGRQVVLGKTKP
jgi:hypothetical protein